MKPTITLQGDKARETAYKAVNKIYNVVRATFGPEGRNALLFRAWNRGSRITNDGVTVAECITPRDIHERLVADVVKESAKKTNEKVGDGTTFTTIFVGHLFNKLYKLLSGQDGGIDVGNSSNIGVISLKKQIIKSAKNIQELVKNNAKKIETLKDLEKIATVSVQDEELGKTVAKMAWEVGLDGFIDVVEGYKGEIETEIIKGFKFPAKVPGKAFVNNPSKFEMLAQDCPVLITNYALDNIKQIMYPLAEILKKNPKLIIVAPQFSESVLEAFWKTMFAVNQQGQVSRRGVDIYPVKTPSLRTEQFEDLSIYCKAKFINKDKGEKLENMDINNLGFLGKLIVKDSEAKEDAIATGGAGTKNIIGKLDNGTEVEGVSPVQERINILKKQKEETKTDVFKKLLDRRIASMASAVGIIRVGGSTDAENLYQKLKIEDCVYACKAALKGGYVKGGGICLKEISETLTDDDILKETCLAPYEQIQSSVDGGLEISEDIIDPADVIYYGIEHAVGIVSNLITLDSITAEIEDYGQHDGEYAIAKQIQEFVVSDKINKGQLKESESEAWKDAKGGLTDDEFIALDRG
jgi:chaperonin GroEL